MSWIERLNNEMTITCGDGNTFTPQWINAEKTREYNITEFNFPEVSGTLVKRKQPKGRKYQIEIYFQGENNIELSSSFETSADDPRPWVISHPYYDRIIVQPVSLHFDNTKHNSTRITGIVIETITDEKPKTTVNPLDKIGLDQENVNTSFEEAYANEVDPEIDDVNQMTKNNNSLFLEGEKSITKTIDFENYFNLYNTATSAILNAVSHPLEAIRTIQAVINAPFQFSETVKNRINTLVNQFNKLIDTITSSSRVQEKKLYENNSGVLVSTMCVAVVTNPDYENRNEVVLQIDELLSTYNSYVDKLDEIQSSNANSLDSFIPNYRSQLLLNDLVNYTISNLFDIAIGSRQERSVVLEEDNNIVNLAYRFYGMVDDSTIDELVSTNQIGLNEYLNVKKGRKLVYFV